MAHTDRRFNGSRRYGRFRVGSDMFFEEFDFSKWSAFFANFIILRAEHSFYAGEIEYTAWSPLFNEIDLGMLAPEYVIMITEFVDEGAPPTYSFSAILRAL